MSIDRVPGREVEVDEDVTLGDIDVNLDAIRGTTCDADHPYEVDTRADAIVIAHDRGDRLTLEVISPEAAVAFADELAYAADHAAQYKRERDGSEVGE